MTSLMFQSLPRLIDVEANLQRIPAMGAHLFSIPPTSYRRGSHLGHGLQTTTDEPVSIPPTSYRRGSKHSLRFRFKKERWFQSLPRLIDVEALPLLPFSLQRPRCFNPSHVLSTWKLARMERANIIYRVFQSLPRLIDVEASSLPAPRTCWPTSFNPSHVLSTWKPFLSHWDTDIKMLFQSLPRLIDVEASLLSSTRWNSMFQSLPRLIDVEAWPCAASGGPTPTSFNPSHVLSTWKLVFRIYSVSLRKIGHSRAPVNLC